MADDKKNNITYTLKICFNPDTDEVEYIAEGMDDSFNFTAISPFNLESDITTIITWEDMEMIRELYDIEYD